MRPDDPAPVGSASRVDPAPVRATAKRLPATAPWETWAAVLLIVALGVVGFTLGADWFKGFFGVSGDVGQTARICLALAGASVAVMIIAAINALSIRVSNHALDLRFDKAWNGVLEPAAAIAAGTLIGITIFR